jgi:hypothetical protein
LAIRLWFHPATPADVRLLLKEAAAFLRARVRVEHPLPVHVLHGHAVEDGATAGQFLDGEWGVCIDLAYNQNDKELVLTLFHEVRHYEQWRDTGKTWEPGTEDVAKEWHRAFTKSRKITKRGKK